MADEDNSVPVAGHHVNAVTVKPPPFTGSSVNRWFTILEAQFLLARITVDATKCLHVISNVPADVLEQLQDEVILSNVYDNLKTAIVNLYRKTEPELYNDLLNCNVLATKPTLYLQRLRSIASGWKLPDEFLKIQFLNAMPSNIKPNLVAHTGTLDQIAQVADTLLAYNYNHVRPNTSNNHYANTSNINYYDHDDMQDMNSSQHSINHTHSHRDQRQSNNRPNDRQNNFRRDNDPTPLSLKPFAPNQKPQVCRYHLYFGHSAKYCQNWCILNNRSLPSSDMVNNHRRANSPKRSPASEN